MKHSAAADQKGLIYAAKYGEIDFTVAKFDDFLIRKRG